MFRYRCPHCSVVLQALELRAGKTTVCSKCSQAVTIPADKSQWVNEKGDPLLTSPTMVVPSSGVTPPPLSRTPSFEDYERPEQEEADSDVLGAISHGDIDLPSLEEARAPDPKPRFEQPAMSPAPAFSRSLPEPEPDDGKVDLYPASTSETPRPPITPQPPSKNPTPPPRAVPRRSVPTAIQPKVVTPPPRLPVPTPPPARPQRTVQAEDAPNGAMAIDEPLRLRTSADIAVDLTSALASRMKPPPKPPRDLKPSTAVWILTSGIGVALIAATLLTTNNFTKAVLTIGAAQVLAGYAWVTALAFRRDVQRGIVCAVPPLTFWYLTNWKYAKYRPLKFVIAGSVLIGLALLTPLVQSRTRSWAGIHEGPAPVVAPPEIASLPKLDQLRYYREQRQYSLLISLLKELSTTDKAYSAEAPNRVDILKELHNLCVKNADQGVKNEALAAYTAWDGPEARVLCIEASRSQNSDERKMALRLLPRWNDEFVARRIAELITGRGDLETSAAADALITIGGTVAENAVIRLLSSDEQSIRLKAIDVLGNKRVGGATSLAELKELVRKTVDPGTRQSAETAIRVLEERLNK